MKSGMSGRQLLTPPRPPAFHRLPSRHRLHPHLLKVYKRLLERIEARPGRLLRGGGDVEEAVGRRGVAGVVEVQGPAAGSGHVVI